MNGRLVSGFLVAATIIAGAAAWYLQQYGFYDRIDPASPQAALALQTETGPVALQVTGFQGIDATSSPIRWRACGQVQQIPDAPVPYADATPLIGPRWFDCCDASTIGADLESGAAQAVLGQLDIRPDVDRIFAIYPDGRIFGWHQFNEKNPERGVMD